MKKIKKIKILALSCFGGDSPTLPVGGAKTEFNRLFNLLKLEEQIRLVFTELHKVDASRASWIEFLSGSTDDKLRAFILEKIESLKSVTKSKKVTKPIVQAVAVDKPVPVKKVETKPVINQAATDSPLAGALKKLCFWTKNA